MTVYILRGIPGSGKSTWAQEYIEGDPSARMMSADNHFNMLDGTYRFDPKMLRAAHQTCFYHFNLHIKNPIDVIVDNTNTRLWEMSPYVAVAGLHGHDVKIIHFRCPPEVAWKRCVHGVPLEKIQAMAMRFEVAWPWMSEEVIETSLSP